MRAIVGQNLAGTRAEITFSDGLPGMAPTPGNQQLAGLADQASRDLGFGPVVAGDPGARGGGDVSYVAQYLDCLDGLGAPGKGDHAAGETINLKEFPKLVERAALMIYRLTR